METSVHEGSEQDLDISLRSIMEDELHLSFDDVMAVINEEVDVTGDGGQQTGGSGGGSGGGGGGGGGGVNLEDFLDLVVSDYIKGQFQLVSLDFVFSLIVVRLLRYLVIPLLVVTSTVVTAVDAR